MVQTKSLDSSTEEGECGSIGLIGPGQRVRSGSIDGSSADIESLISSTRPSLLRIMTL